MNFETKNAHVFAKMCTIINCISFAEHLDTRKKCSPGGQLWKSWSQHHSLELIFEATDSLTPGKWKWPKYSPVDYENLRRLEDTSDFNTRVESWLEIVYIHSCHFDSTKPLNKDVTLTRPQLEVKHYHMDMDLTQA